MGELRAEYPYDLHPHCFAHIIRQKYGLGDVFYLDLWPVHQTIMVVADPAAADALVDAPKHLSITDFMECIVGPHNLLSMKGAEWRFWRSVFNPGFSNNNLMTMVPDILEESRVFCEILEKHARDNVIFRMEEIATRLTIDIIGRVIM